MKFLITTLVTSMFFSVLAIATEGDNNILFVVDKSGSMSSRMPAIKSSIGGTVSALPSTHSAGLIAFDGCGPSKVYYKVPLAKRAGRLIAAQVQALRPSGSTALAEALKKADSIMTDNAGMCLKIVVFTDSDDTCGGNVGEIARKWKEQRHKYCLTLDIVTTTENEVLNDLATTLGGSVYIGEYADDITEILRRITARRRASDGSRGSNGEIPPTDDPGDINDDDSEDDQGGSRRQRRRRRSGNRNSRGQ